MEQDARKAILESLKRTSATPAQSTESELYQSISEPDTSTDTLKVKLGSGAPIGQTMNPLGMPVPDDFPKIDDDELDDLELPDLTEDEYAESPVQAMPSKPRGIVYPSQPFVAPDEPDEMPPIYKSSRQSEIEAAAADLDEGAADQSQRMIIKVVVGGIVTLIVFAVIFMGIKGKSNTKEIKPDDKTPAASQSDSPIKTEAVPGDVMLLKNKEVSFDSDLYKDSLTITKIMELRNGNVFCYFKGVPEHFPEVIYIPVSADDYNYFSDGDLVDINYNIATFQGNPYVLNPVLKEN